MGIAVATFCFVNSNQERVAVQRPSKRSVLMPASHCWEVSALSSAGLSRHSDIRDAEAFDIVAVEREFLDRLPQQAHTRSDGGLPAARYGTHPAENVLSDVISALSYRQARQQMQVKRQFHLILQIEPNHFSRRSNTKSSAGSGVEFPP